MGAWAMPDGPRAKLKDMLAHFDTFLSNLLPANGIPAEHHWLQSCPWQVEIERATSRAVRTDMTGRVPTCS